MNAEKPLQKKAFAGKASLPIFKQPLEYEEGFAYIPFAHKPPTSLHLYWKE